MIFLDWLLGIKRRPSQARVDSAQELSAAEATIEDHEQRIDALEQELFGFDRRPQPLYGGAERRRIKRAES